MISSLLLFNATPWVAWVIGGVVCIANATFVLFMYIHIGTEAGMQYSIPEGEEIDTDDLAKPGVRKMFVYVMVKVFGRLFKFLRARKEIEMKRVMRILWGGPGHHPESKDREEPGSPKAQIRRSRRQVRKHLEKSALRFYFEGTDVVSSKVKHIVDCFFRIDVHVFS